MAVTKDWGSVTARCATEYFADGDAAAWCEHTPPEQARCVTVRNSGTGLLYVSVPGLDGAWADTHAAWVLSTGQSQRFVFELAAKPGGVTFSTKGADGAGHKMALLFEACVG